MFSRPQAKIRKSLTVEYGLYASARKSTTPDARTIKIHKQRRWNPQAQPKAGCHESARALRSLIHDHEPNRGSQRLQNLVHCTYQALAGYEGESCPESK